MTQIRTWSPYQTAVFDAVKGTNDSLVVEAVAGSGKTTTIMEALRLIPGDQRIFLGAFNRDIANELSERAKAMPHVDVKTMHALGFSAIRQANKGVGVKVEDRKVHFILDDMTKADPSIKPIANFVRAAVGMAKQEGFGGKSKGLPEIADREAWETMCDHFSIYDKLPEGVPDAEIERAMMLAQVVLRQSNQIVNKIDFNDMVYLPLAHDYRMYQYDVVVIDEAQDINRTRLALIKKLVRKGGRVIAVGDPRQAIYGFSGAMSDALQQIKTTFKARSLPLSVTYRSAKAIVAHAQGVVSHIQAAPSAPEGKVIFMDGAEFAGADLLPSDAILCRNNKPLVEMAFSLIRRGIACKIRGRDIGEGMVTLCEKWKVKTLDTLRDRLDTYVGRELEKATTKKDQYKAQSLTDKVETLRVLIDRAEEKKLDKEGLISMIREMFSDDTGKSILTLSSVHKSKGLEWERVFILDRVKLMPSRFAKQDWELEQEDNLIYVAITRAKSILVEVDLATTTAEAREQALVEA